MTIWVDAQLPPALARWITEQFQIQATSAQSIGLRDASHAEIFTKARQPGHVVMTKDDDFVDLVTRLGSPPQILWVTCGNVTNRALQELLTSAFPKLLKYLAAGEPVVELTNRDKPS